MNRIFKASFLCMIAFVVMTAVASAESLRPLTRHVREATMTGEAPFVGHLPSAQVMRIILVLPLRDPAGLDDFLNELYDPASPTYRNFLTVEQFTDRFGPTQSDYNEAIRFAVANGFEVAATSRNRLNLDVTGTVATIEAALHINLSQYHDPIENRTFYAPDREPTPDLPFALWRIAGLDNYSVPKPLFTRRAEGVKPNATTGSGPSASFLGSDMRAAYYGGSLTGTGQSLGLFEYYGTDLADLTKYFTNAGETNNVKVTLKSTDGTSTSCLNSAGCDDTEQTLDMTQALGMAPGMSSLVVYVGSTDSAIFNSMATASPLNAQLSSSWTWSPADPATDNPYFSEFAAQGQNLFQAAGDSGAWKTTSATWPADSVYLTSVGGTDLTTSSAGGPWKSETVWVNGGGGISPSKFAIPTWQTSAASGCASCSKTYRNAPDVSANANNTFYVCADQTTCTANSYGGTSFAAPMWAGYLALVNQQAVTNTGKPVGFINPSLYSIGLGSSYTTDFHDITSGSNGYSATTGFDLGSGWGSPKGSGLINDLSGSASPSFSLSASPTSVSVVQGSSGTSTITSAVAGGFSSAVALSASGMPTGVTASFSPSSIAAPGSGSSTLTLTVGSSAATGTYTITVTGTGGGLTETTTVSLTVTAGTQPSFTLTASPKSVTVQQGTAGTSTITSSIAGGFSSAVALSASGLPTGVTAGFSPASIASPGSGSSTLTLTASSSAATGTYTVTVTGTGGGLTETTTVSLTVTSSGTPSFTLTANPASLNVAQGAAGTSTITSAISGGFNSAVSLSASGIPFGVTAGFSPTSIAAPGSGSSTLTLTVSSSATVGTYTLTITGTGGGLTQSATVSLTITSGTQPSFTLSANPGSVSVQQGTGGTSSITSSISGGFNSAISLSASGMPSGVTAGFSPASIAAPGSGSSTLTLSASSSAATGTYNITVTGTGGGLTQTTSVSLTVSSGSSTNLVKNGGFETGSFSPWVAAGAVKPTITSAQANSGSYSALIGRTATPEVNGLSDTYQNITIPSTANTATLTFWYWPSTDDTITYAYQEALIKNTSATTLATVMKVASNAQAWTKVTYDLTKYKGQTIRLYFAVHGNGYAKDYVYMYLDDVSVTVQ